MSEKSLTVNNAVIMLGSVAQINEEFRSLLNLCHCGHKYDKLELDGLFVDMMFEPPVNVNTTIKADFTDVMKILSDVSHEARNIMDHEVYEKAEELMGRLRELEWQTE